MDFILLGLIFFATGVGAIAYYRTVPDAATLRNRLPNRPSVAAVILTLIIAGSIWYVWASYGGVGRISRMFALTFSLLVFESVFLFCIRWIRSNALAMTIGLLSAAALLWAYYVEPTFFVLGVIVTIATLGAATLLIRLGYLRSIFLMFVAALWTVYDVIFVSFILPAYSRPTSSPFPTFIFPSVLVGNTSLGSGDFMFLTLFTLILLREFNVAVALVGAGVQALALLATGLLLGGETTPVPFLLVMTPLFLAVYLLAYLRRSQRSVQTA